MVLANNQNAPERKQRGRPRAFDDKTDQNIIKSLDRALTVLSELATLDHATLTELSTHLNQAPATVYRVLTTFAQHGIVEMNKTTQMWYIGPNAFLIGSTFLRRTGLVDVSRPILRDLMERTGETANLGVEKDGSVLFISQIETHAPIRAFFPPGTLSPLHASGIGKTLLAHATPKRVTRYASKGMTHFTDFTKSTLEGLTIDLAEIKSRGYSIDDEERNLGMRCIAAPIYDVYGEVVAGISVSGPTSRVTPQKVFELAQHVTNAAKAVSYALGAQIRPSAVP